jgi:Ca2+-binding RTX toxin-like protein
VSGFSRPNFLAFNTITYGVGPETLLFEPAASFVSIEVASAQAGSVTLEAFHDGARVASATAALTDVLSPITVSAPTITSVILTFSTSTLVADDLLWELAGAEPVMCGGRAATIIGSARGERLTGTAGVDVIAALGGADTIHGNGARDVICGGKGNDFISGGGAADRLYGGGGKDEVHAESGRDTLAGGRGADRLYGDLDGDWLRGGRGDDLVHAGPGDDSLDGSRGLDRCNGGSGSDTATRCEKHLFIP